MTSGSYGIVRGRWFCSLYLPHGTHWVGGRWFSSLYSPHAGDAKNLFVVPATWSNEHADSVRWFWVKGTANRISVTNLFRVGFTWYRWKEEVCAVILSYSTTNRISVPRRRPSGGYNELNQRHPWLRSWAGTTIFGISVTRDFVEKWGGDKGTESASPVTSDVWRYNWFWISCHPWLRSGRYNELNQRHPWLTEWRGTTNWISVTRDFGVRRVQRTESASPVTSECGGYNELNQRHPWLRSAAGTTNWISVTRDFGVRRVQRTESASPVTSECGGYNELNQRHPWLRSAAGTTNWISVTRDFRVRRVQRTESKSPVTSECGGYNELNQRHPWTQSAAGTTNWISVTRDFGVRRVQRTESASPVNSECGRYNELNQRHPWFQNVTGIANWVSVTYYAFSLWRVQRVASRVTPELIRTLLRVTLAWAHRLQSGRLRRYFSSSARVPDSGRGTTKKVQRDFRPITYMCGRGTLSVFVTWTTLRVPRLG